MPSKKQSNILSKSMMFDAFRQRQDVANDEMKNSIHDIVDQFYNAEAGIPSPEFLAPDDERLAPSGTVVSAPDEIDVGKDLTNINDIADIEAELEKRRANRPNFPKFSIDGGSHVPIGMASPPTSTVVNKSIADRASKLIGMKSKNNNSATSQSWVGKTSNAPLEMPSLPKVPNIAKDVTTSPPVVSPNFGQQNLTTSPAGGSIGSLTGGNMSGISGAANLGSTVQGDQAKLAKAFQTSFKKAAKGLIGASALYGSGALSPPERRKSKARKIISKVKPREEDEDPLSIKAKFIAPKDESLESLVEKYNISKSASGFEKKSIGPLALALIALAGGGVASLAPWALDRYWPSEKTKALEELNTSNLRQAKSNSLDQAAMSVDDPGTLANHPAYNHLMQHFTYGRKMAPQDAHLAALKTIHGLTVHGEDPDYKGWLANNKNLTPENINKYYDRNYHPSATVSQDAARFNRWQTRYKTMAKETGSKDPFEYIEPRGALKPSDIKSTSDGSTPNPLGIAQGIGATDLSKVRPSEAKQPAQTEGPQPGVNKSIPTTGDNFLSTIANNGLVNNAALAGGAALGSYGLYSALNPGKDNKGRSKSRIPGLLAGGLGLGLGAYGLSGGNPSNLFNSQFWKMSQAVGGAVPGPVVPGPVVPGPVVPNPAPTTVPGTSKVNGPTAVRAGEGKAGPTPSAGAGALKVPTSPPPTTATTTVPVGTPTLSASGATARGGPAPVTTSRPVSVPSATSTSAPAAPDAETPLEHLRRSPFGPMMPPAAPTTPTIRSAAPATSSTNPTIGGFNPKYLLRPFGEMPETPAGVEDKGGLLSDAEKTIKGFLDKANKHIGGVKNVPGLLARDPAALARTSIGQQAAIDAAKAQIGSAKFPEIGFKDMLSSWWNNADWGQRASVLGGLGLLGVGSLGLANSAASGDGEAGIGSYLLPMLMAGGGAALGSYGLTGSFNPLSGKLFSPSQWIGGPGQNIGQQFTNIDDKGQATPIETKLKGRMLGGEIPADIAKNPELVKKHNAAMADALAKHRPLAAVLRGAQKDMAGVQQLTQTMHYLASLPPEDQQRYFARQLASGPEGIGLIGAAATDPGTQKIILDSATRIGLSPEQSKQLLANMAAVWESGQKVNLHPDDINASYPEITE